MTAHDLDSAEFSLEEAPRLEALLQRVATSTNSRPWEHLRVGPGCKYWSRWDLEGVDVLELPTCDMQALTPRELLVFLLSSSWHKEDPSRARLLRAQKMLDTLESEKAYLLALGKYRFLDLFYLQVLAFSKWARPALDQVARDFEVAALWETAQVIGVEETIQFCRKNHGAQIWADSSEASGLRWANRFHETAAALDAAGPPLEVALDIADAFEEEGELEYLTDLFHDLRQNGPGPRIPKAVEPSMTAWDVLLGDRELYPSRWVRQ